MKHSARRSKKDEQHDLGRANTACCPHHVRKMIAVAPARPHTLADMAVAIFAIAVAGFMLVRSFPLSDELWRDLMHDRNGHYAFGLKLALHLRDLDIAGFLVELEKPKVWPQLHGLVLAAVLLIGGIDHRLGIVPSLIGWVMTVWFCWRIAIRSFDHRSLGIIAGIAAVALVATSPAFALMSTDVMLEGLGSGLSALCLWAFMAAYAEPDKAWRWRLLAVALTLLFFEKYNYWAFAVTSIALAALLIDARVRALAWSAAKEAVTHAPEMLKSPFFIAGIVVLGAAAAIGLRGPTALEILGERVSLYPPFNIVTAGYALLFVASVLLWRTHRVAIARFIGPPGSMLLAWHVLPVAVSFLLPRRLAGFVWFLGPSNDPLGENPGMAGAAAIYARAIVGGFVSLPSIGWTCLALFAAGAIFMKRIRPEGRIVFAFAAVSAIALIVHPQHQQRFLTTSMFALFSGAGIGLAILAQFIAPETPRRGLRLASRQRRQCWRFSCGCLIHPRPMPRPSAPARELPISSSRASTSPSSVPERTWRSARRSATPRCCPGQSSNDANACSRSTRPWVGPQSTRAEAAAAGKAWLETTEARQAVLVDMPGDAGAFWRYEDMVGLVDAVSLQSRFHVVREIASSAPPARILILQRPRGAASRSRYIEAISAPKTGARPRQYGLAGLLQHLPGFAHER